MKLFKKIESAEVESARWTVKQYKQYLKIAKEDLKAAIKNAKMSEQLTIIEQALENIKKTKK